MTNNTRKHPRTLQEAFGPYTSSDFAYPRSKGEVFTALLSAVAFAAFVWVAWSL